MKHMTSDTRHDKQEEKHTIILFMELVVIVTVSSNFSRVRVW